MQSTLTIDALARRVLGYRLSEALEEVYLERTEPRLEPDASSLNDLAKRYLAPQTNQAFTKVDLKAEEFGVGVRIEGLYVYMRGRGLSMIIIVIIIAILTVGVGPLLDILQVLQR